MLWNLHKIKKGYTPLIWSAGKGHQAAVALLLLNGADVDKKDNVSKLNELLNFVTIFCFSLIFYYDDHHKIKTETIKWRESNMVI